MRLFHRPLFNLFTRLAAYTHTHSDLLARSQQFPEEVNCTRLATVQTLDLCHVLVVQVKVKDACVLHQSLPLDGLGDDTDAARSVHLQQDL